MPACVCVCVCVWGEVVLQPSHPSLSCNPEQRFHFCVRAYIDFCCVWMAASVSSACLFFCSMSELLFLIKLPVSLQVELTGSSVFDYIHPADHVEMAERLGIRPHLRAEAGCHTAPESASSSASTSSLSGTPEPGLDSNIHT